MPVTKPLGKRHTAQMTSLENVLDWGHSATTSTIIVTQCHSKHSLFKFDYIFWLRSLAVLRYLAHVT